MKTHLRSILPLAVLLFLASCGGPPETTDEVAIPGYGELREQITGRDVSALEGRLIVLDPGHGGYFKGAVGPAGLTEAEVNLGVALNLRGLLEWAGADVVMTRTSDTDFLSPADSTLAGDLAFRVAISDSIQPDVFLSLHHNSVASLDRSINETQTYYPLGDSGASLDLARAIHRHLVLNLEIRPAKILPGNFHVLRNATVPAVLGEPAMISNPVIEGRLSLASSQRLEAEAYFLGLLDYFGQGNPSWSGAPLDTLVAPEPGLAASMTWTYQPDGDRGDRTGSPPLDPTTVQVTLNGEPQPIRIGTDGSTVTWNGSATRHDQDALLEITARNTRGRSTPEKRTLVRAGVSRTLEVTLFRTNPGGVPVGLSWETADGRPLPVGAIRFPGVGKPLIIDGGVRGWNPLTIDPGKNPEMVYEPLAGGPAPEIVIHERTLPAGPSWFFLTLANNARVRAMTGDGLDEWASLRFKGASTTIDPAVLAYQGTPLIPWKPGQPVWLEMPGYLPLIDPSPGESAEGRTLDARESPRFTSMLHHDLFARVIVLDPAGGDSNPDGTGPLGLRGADLNLEVANLLAQYLRGAGAVVHLTHQEGTVPLPEDKVALANRVRADFFLTLGRSSAGEGATARHHHGSNSGSLWAKLAAEAAAPLMAPQDSLAVQPSYDYLLRHTACPALEVLLPGPNSEAAEIRMTTRAWARAEAQALYLALASVSTQGEALLPTLNPAEALDQLPDGMPTGEVDLVILDGQFSWSPPATNSSNLSEEGNSGSGTDSLPSWNEPGFAVSPGPHTLEVRAGNSWQLWLVTVPEGATPLYAHSLLLMSGP